VAWGERVDGFNLMMVTTHDDDDVIIIIITIMFPLLPHACQPYHRKPR